MRSRRWARSDAWNKPGLPASPRYRRPWKRRLALVGIIVLVYGVFFSPLFTIQNVTIEGNQRISTERLTAAIQHVQEQRRWLIFSNRHLFFFNVNEVVRVLNERRLERLTAQWEPWGRLRLSVTEKPAVSLWQGDGRWYELDPGGVIIAEMGAPAADDKRPRLTNSKTVRERSVGDQVASREVLSRIGEIHAGLPADLGFRVERYDTATIEAGEITALTSEGWVLRFSTVLDVPAQFRKLDVFVRERNSTNGTWRHSLEYIDLRFGTTRVYYK